MEKGLVQDKLTCTCNPELFECESSSDVEPLRNMIGQAKALKALEFGIEIKGKGFNVYVSGLPGTGKKTAVQRFLQEIAKDKPAPSDWCYVNNFQENFKPKALSLPAGRARKFKKQIDAFVEAVRSEVGKTFESEDYALRRNETIRFAQAERDNLIMSMNQEARNEGFVIQATPMGLLTTPIRDNKALPEEELMTLDRDAQDLIKEKRHSLSEKMKISGRQLVAIERKTNEMIDKLDREVGAFAIDLLMEDLKESHQDVPGALNYLREMREDMLENLSLFRSDELKPDMAGELPPPMPFSLPTALKVNLLFRKYTVNIVVDNTELTGAPIVMELNPSYNNLFGRIEKEALQGALFTDFTMVRSGSLHKANGGYLILPAYDVLMNILSWDTLKRFIRSCEVRIEDAEEKMGFMATRWLTPDPIPLDVKVILIGDPSLYHRLFHLDPDFRDLFKVNAGFDTVMDKNEENIKVFSTFVCNVCKEENLRHFDKYALAKVADYSCRLTNNQGKLSTRFGEITDMMREASFYAAKEGAPLVSASHVRQAIEERFNRSSLYLEKIREQIDKGILMIVVDGEAVGQVNGLTVMDLGYIMFGIPSKITASTGLGTEGLIHIDREAKLGGPIHTKGVLILTGYLALRYSQDKPLSLSARLVFEQSYYGVEGDSASSTELYALLSAISGIPINQGIAVTGSVNQKGEVQAIGGVNEKVEGFFDICKLKGLTGRQGVMIPACNVQNLVLRDDVVQAVKEGNFHIWNVSTIDEGMEVLTGRKAGRRNKKGIFEKGSVNSLVDLQLRKFSELWMSFSGNGHEKNT